MKWWIWTIIILIVLFLVLAIFSGDKELGTTPTKNPTSENDEWTTIRANDIAQTNSEWKNPTYIEVNDKNWEDGVYISGDGNKLYFTYYPGEDLITDVAKENYAGDLDIMVSEKESDGQFRTKKMDTRFFLGEDIWSEGAIMIDSKGNLFYDSNRDYLNDQKADPDIYRNKERLALNGDGDEERGNPHYCEVFDELWMSEKDHRIYVLRDATKNDWSGNVELAPTPINPSNSEVSSTQPFLTKDCMTMYLTTNRGDTPSKAIGPAIYKSTRNEDGTWNKLELIIWSNLGVGEPTLTDDETRLYFIQVFKHPNGGMTSDMFFVEKE